MVERDVSAVPKMCVGAVCICVFFFFLGVYIATVMDRETERGRDGGGGCRKPRERVAGGSQEIPFSISGSYYLHVCAMLCLLSR